MSCLIPFFKAIGQLNNYLSVDACLTVSKWTEHMFKLFIRAFTIRQGQRRKNAMLTKG